MPKFRPTTSKGYVRTPYRKQEEFTIFEDDPIENATQNQSDVIQHLARFKEEGIVENTTPNPTSKSQNKSISHRMPLSSVHHNSMRAHVHHDVSKPSATKNNSKHDALKVSRNLMNIHAPGTVSREEDSPLDNFEWEPWMDDELENAQVPWMEPHPMHQKTFYCDELNAKVAISGVAIAPLKWQGVPIDPRRTKEQLTKHKKHKFVAPLMMPP